MKLHAHIFNKIVFVFLFCGGVSSLFSMEEEENDELLTDELLTLATAAARAKKEFSLPNQRDFSRSRGGSTTDLMKSTQSAVEEKIAVARSQPDYQPPSPYAPEKRRGAEDESSESRNQKFRQRRTLPSAPARLLHFHTPSSPFPAYTPPPVSPFSPHSHYEAIRRSALHFNSGESPLSPTNHSPFSFGVPTANSSNFFTNGEFAQAASVSFSSTLMPTTQEEEDYMDED